MLLAVLDTAIPLSNTPTLLDFNTMSDKTVKSHVTIMCFDLTSHRSPTFSIVNHWTVCNNVILGEDS